MAKLNGRDILLIGCLLGGGTPSSDVQMYATKVESEGDECPDTLSPDDVYFTIPVATIEGQREPKVGDYLVYDHNVANTSGCKQILCEITELDDRGEPYRHGVYMRAICFMPVVEESGSESDSYFDIEGTITTSTTSLVLQQIPPNAIDIIILLEGRSNSYGSSKLTQIGKHNTGATIESNQLFVAYRQANTSVAEVPATYDSENQTLTLTHSYFAKNYQYRYFVKLS